MKQNADRPVGSDRIYAVESGTDESVHYERSASRLDNARVIRALEEYRAALEAGRNPERQAFLARYPEIAQSLAECLDGLEFVHQAAPQLSQPAAVKPETPSADIQPEGPLGDFRIIREIGCGGMGVVYEAMQISLGRRVALKVLPFAAALDAKQLQRFKNEAQAAAFLQHTNIVPVHYVGCERGVHFYAMQYIEGQTLAALIGELRQQAGKEDERSRIDVRGWRAEDRGSERPEASGTIEGRGPTNETEPARPPSIFYPLSSILVFPDRGASGGAGGRGPGARSQQGHRPP